MKGYVQIIAGSTRDDPFVNKIIKKLGELGRAYDHKVYSGHKQTQQLLNFLRKIEGEPVVFMTVAGRSNSLSGIVAGNDKRPVIACPPLEDKASYQINIHSSLQMPSDVPAMTILDPENAALAADRMLKMVEKYSKK